MPSSSPQHIAGLLTELRRLFMTRPRAAEDMARETALYVEALQDLDARYLTAAVKSWLRTGTRFPLPADLRKLAEAEAEREQAKAQMQIVDQRDLGAEMRNEAIMLLGDFGRVAARTLGAPSREHANFVAEAARMWGGVRPQGGLSEVDTIRGGRAAYGAAMEAWARAHLGLEPIPAGYVTAKAMEIHLAMTGREIRAAASSAPSVGSQVAQLASSLRAAE